MGVTHHSVYPVWFEAGRTDYIRARGEPYGKLEADGLFLPLIEMSCKFKGYSRYEDALEIRTRVQEATKSRLSFLYEVIREDRLIAIGTTTHIYANRQLKPVNLGKYKPETLRLFQSFAGGQ